MTQEQLDNMFNQIYPQFNAARSAIDLSDAVDNLIVAVWSYQSSHNVPKCEDLERALAVASHVQEEYTNGPADAVEKLYYLRGLESLRYHELRVEHEWQRQAALAKEKAKAAKPKKAKAPKVKLAKAA